MRPDKTRGVEGSLRKVQSDQLAAVAASFLRLRPRLLAPVGPIVLLVLYQARLPREQLAVLAANFLCMLGFFFWESSRTRRVPIDERSLSRSLVITVVGLALLSGFSGGAESPFVPILVAPVGIAFAAFGRGSSTRLVLAALALSTLYILASPTLFPWPRIPAPYVVVIRVLAIALTLTLLYFGVTRLAMAYRATAERLEAMRLEVIDTTARRTTELEALGSRLAHELKNPLASIKGLVQLTHKTVRSNPELKPTAKRLDVVLQEVSRLEQVLWEYSNFTRPVAELRRAPVNVGRFLRDFVALVDGQAQALGVSIRLSAPESTAMMDSDKMKQVLLNLAQNALSAMPHGGQLLVFAKRVPGAFEITVSDDGEGMSEEVLRRIKEPFFSGREGGTGLGVVIADRIVVAHSGRLVFESEVGRGTTATVLLPVSEETP